MWKLTDRTQSPHLPRALRLIQEVDGVFRLEAICNSLSDYSIFPAAGSVAVSQSGAKPIKAVSSFHRTPV